MLSTCYFLLLSPSPFTKTTPSSYKFESVGGYSSVLILAFILWWRYEVLSGLYYLGFILYFHENWIQGWVILVDILLLSLTTWDDLADTQEYLGLQPEQCTSVTITQAH